MRIRHGALEDCRRDVRAWVVQHAAGGTFARGGYDMGILAGIYRFHRDGEPAPARRHIEEFLANRRLRNPQRIERALQDFDGYVHWSLSQRNATVADHRVRLNLSLGDDVVLGGEISRIDLTDNGYRAVLLKAAPPGWQTELRMPLIQRALATDYQRPEHEISIGFQNLDGGALDVVTYDRKAVETAAAEARDLAARVRAEMARQGRA
jgi:hypothetical protein